MSTYKPLPDSVTVGLSSIEGLGLIATEDMGANTQLGMLHYYVSNDEIIRTPLAGFLNHSNTPNCLKAVDGTGANTRTYLVTKGKIKEGEELTIEYDLYKPQ